MGTGLDSGYSTSVDTCDEGVQTDSYSLCDISRCDRGVQCSNLGGLHIDRSACEVAADMSGSASRSACEVAADISGCASSTIEASNDSGISKDGNTWAILPQRVVKVQCKNRRKNSFANSDYWWSDDKFWNDNTTYCGHSC